MAETKKTTKTAVTKKTVTPKVAEAKKVTEKAVVKKEAEVKASVTVKTETKTKAISVDVFDLTGKVVEKISLPGEVFGETVNKQLLAQAVRVYLANKRQGNASTKTRGEVEGSTRKIYRQKGTGRARHGGVRAPIFVKGGIVFGPKPRDFSLDLPKKMKRKALFSALSAKVADKEITVLSGVEKLEPKTKQFVAVLQKLALNDKKKKILVVMAGENDAVKRATSNITGVMVTAANRLNAYDVLNTKRVILVKESVDVIKATFLAKK
ncbi:MAG: 50S ribosomal protein L4 [Patescibacteria group bacterium]